MRLPKLRPVEAFPTELSGKQIICLRDQRGFTENVVGIPMEMLCFIPFFDGQHTFEDLQENFLRVTGVPLPTEQIQDFVKQLDEQYFLDSEKFQTLRESIVKDFRQQQYRESTLTGSCYESDPELLRTQLDSYFQNLETVQRDSSQPVSGFVAPHIDIRNGGPCYAAGYQRLLLQDIPELVVILGTGHQGVEGIFAATQKSFRTPLGIMETDRKFIDQLVERFGDDLMHDEYAHKSEHVIEFQVLFLQRVFERLGKLPKIAPILCSFDHRMLDPEEFPENAEVIHRFCTALRELVEEHDSVCIIASADMSHVGPMYGDEKGLDDKEQEALRESDALLLKIIESGDPEGFASALSRIDNRTRVCGFAPIYTMLKALDGVRGETVQYDRTDIDDEGSIVTFASVILH